MNPLIALQGKKKMPDSEFAKWLGVPRATLRNWKCAPGEPNHRPIPTVVQRYLGLLELLEITVPGFTDAYVESLPHEK